MIKYSVFKAEGNGFNQGVDSVQPESSNSPPDCCIEFVRFPSSNTLPKNKTTPQGGFIIWWSRGESNPCPKATWKDFLRAQFVIYIPFAAREQTLLRHW